MQVPVNVSMEILDWVIAHIKIDALPNQIRVYLNLWVNGEKNYL